MPHAGPAIRAGKGGLLRKSLQVVATVVAESGGIAEPRSRVMID